MDPKVIGISAALGSAASWAVGSILFKRLGESLPSSAMTLAKELLGVVLLAVAVGGVGFQQLDPQSLMLLVVSGLLGIALGDTFFFEALQDLGPLAVVLLLTLGQVLTVVMAVLFLGDTPTPAAWSGILLVIGGVGVVLYAKATDDSHASRRRGILLGLLAVACMSISMIVAKKGLDTVSAIQATFIRMLAGAVGMLAFGIATRRLGGWVVPFRDARLAALFLAAVSVVTFGGFWLSLVAIKHIDVSIANALNSSEPVFILPLAVVFLKEKITLSALAGTGLTVTGIVLLCIA
jgi:drug/metabolite transporter (DMT)-like permease